MQLQHAPTSGLCIVASGIVDVALALLTAEAILRTPSSRVVVVVYAGADHIRKQAVDCKHSVNCGVKRRDVVCGLSA